MARPMSGAGDDQPDADELVLAARRRASRTSLVAGCWRARRRGARTRAAPCGATASRRLFGRLALRWAPRRHAGVHGTKGVSGSPGMSAHGRRPDRRTAAVGAERRRRACRPRRTARWPCTATAPSGPPTTANSVTLGSPAARRRRRRGRSPGRTSARRRRTSRPRRAAGSAAGASSPPTYTYGATCVAAVGRRRTG